MNNFAGRGMRRIVWLAICCTTTGTPPAAPSRIRVLTGGTSPTAPSITPHILTTSSPSHPLLLAMSCAVCGPCYAGLQPLLTIYFQVHTIDRGPGHVDQVSSRHVRVRMGYRVRVGAGARVPKEYLDVAASRSALLRFAHTGSSSKWCPPCALSMERGKCSMSPS